MTDRVSSHAVGPNPRLVLPQPDYPPVTTEFAAWVDRIPDRPAVVEGDRIWTYQQLDRCAREIARTLLNLGLEPGDAIAVSGERGFGLIAAMVGVLMSRGVLLNVDPSLPLARRQLMEHQARVQYRVCVGVDRPNSPPNSDLQNLDSQNLEITVSKLVDDRPVTINIGIAQEPSSNGDRLSSPHPDDAAYIFFTSGSTGTPKGVLGCHKGLSHFLHWQQQTFAVDSGDRCAQLSALSFDVMLRDVFLPLTSGGTLYLPTSANRLDPRQILPWLEREQISTIHVVPSLVRSWLRDVPPNVTLPSLLRIFFAGEPLSDRLVRQWRQQFPEAGEIINLYGPTETTLAKCYYRVPDPPEAGIQPIGVPLPETQILILTPDNRLCRVGEPGEIVIRTPFCSLGYLDPSPEEAARFVPNPFGDDLTDRVYRTGDRGCYRADGTIAILGRLDRQVKIRGVRVEPREIEEVLEGHPDIWQGAVVSQQNHFGEIGLVAYLVCAGASVPSASQLRQFLHQQLPEVMVPAGFVWLDALPLNPNGKIDRRILASQQWQPTRKRKAPQTEVERRLVRIWQGVLGVSEVGIEDDFFELGGNSLSAVRVISEIEEAFGCSLCVANLFEAATIEQLACHLDGDRAGVASAGIVPLKPSGRKPPFFFVNSIGYARQLQVYFDIDRPLYGLSIFRLGLREKELAKLRLEEIAARAIEQIQTVRSSGPYLLGAYCADITFAFEIARQLQERGGDVQMLVSIDGIWQPRPSSVQLYWENLRQFGANYLLEKCQDKLKESARSLKKTIDSLCGAVSQNPRKSLQDDRLLWAFAKATHNYQPHRYSGRIQLFLASEWRLKNSPILASFSTQPLETEEIFGYHHRMFEEPQVRVLADKLNACLDRATFDVLTGRDLKNG
ncbi:MAG: amino acid adenylation domain-containing protein [Cyanobacteriota bacterium]|nr:amino acid adenylation domain-containing protein [Cyanobacteriota bacterium]